MGNLMRSSVRSSVRILIFIALGLALAEDGQPYSEFNSMFGEQENPFVSFIRSSPLGKTIRRVVPASTRDLYTLLITKPPTKLEQPLHLKHGSINDVQDNFINSMITLCDDKQFLTQKCACPELYSDIQALDDRSIYGLVVLAVNVKQKKIVLSYRGTETVQNLLTDLDFQMTSIPGWAQEIQVHRGFYSHYLGLYYHTRTAMLKYLAKYPNYPLQITGYSLGGALSTLSLPDWVTFLKEQNDTRPVELYTYSSPRAGNAAFVSFVQSLNVPMTRYTYQDDPVPHMPPRSAGYVHVGVEIHEEVANDGKKSFTECAQDYDEDPNCAFKEKDHLKVEQHLQPFNRTFPTPPFC